jgi:membrane fusion protein, multidrug efflux system
MNLGDTYDKCSRQLDRPYSAVGFLYDSGQTCDHGQQGCSTAEADFRGVSGCLDPPERTGRIKRLLMLMGATLASLSALAFNSSYLWSYFQSYESTGVARIVAQTTPINARIDGTITGLYVESFQRVKGGQLLVQLDPRDREIAVEQARALLSQAETNVDISRQQYALVRAEIREAQARDLEGQQEQQRYLTLLRMGVISRAEYDQHSANSGVLGAAVKADQAEAAVAFRDIVLRLAQVQTAKVSLDQAMSNLDYTRIVAPADAIVGLRTGELGQRVEPGESLMVLARLDDLWVTADFKKKQLARIHGEQAVTIHVDALGRDFRGHIQSVPGMSGPLSRLLPPQQFGDSHVKDAQRLAVPILFDADQDLSGLLPGMSVEATVWLKPNLQ